MPSSAAMAATGSGASMFASISRIARTSGGSCQASRVTAALAERRTGGAVCYASGFSEIGAEGAGLQARLVGAAGAMPVLGPNCYGMINYLDGALLWPDQHGGRRVERGVALVTQSSNIAINPTMQRRGLPIAYVATLGNLSSKRREHYANRIVPGNALRRPAQDNRMATRGSAASPASPVPRYPVARPRRLRLATASIDRST